MSRKRKIRCEMLNKKTSEAVHPAAKLKKVIFHIVPSFHPPLKSLDLKHFAVQTIVKLLVLLPPGSG